MQRFAILPLESSNRVYGAQACSLLAAELAALAGQLDNEVADIKPTEFGGVEYLTFSLSPHQTNSDTAADSTELSTNDAVVLSNLSGTRALFEVVASGVGGPELLRPVHLDVLAWYDSDLLTIQRYTGKTNEQFTHLMVNLGVAASAAAAERVADGKPIRVFDPVAGRGTTLNRALMMGYDASGIELSGADCDQFRGFIANYLRDHRVKHTTERENIRKGPLAGSARFAVTIRRKQRVELVNGDTTLADQLLPAKSADVLVADLPYGIQHRATTGAQAHARKRSPGELLEDSLPAWRSVVRGGGSLVFGWNLKTLPRESVEMVLSDAGFSIVEHPQSFEHAVDRSITRDVIVAHR